MLRPLPVVLQRLASCRLLPAAHQRQTPDLQQFRCRKEHHVHGIAVYRIAQAALIDHQRLHPSPFRLHRTSQPGWPCTHTNHVVCRHICSISPFFTRLRNSKRGNLSATGRLATIFAIVSNAPRQRLEGAPSRPPFCRMDSYDQSRNALLLLRLPRAKKVVFSSCFPRRCDQPFTTFDSPRPPPIPSETSPTRSTSPASPPLASVSKQILRLPPASTSH